MTYYAFHLCWQLAYFAKHLKTSIWRKATSYATSWKVKGNLLIGDFLSLILPSQHLTHLSHMACFSLYLAGLSNEPCGRVTVNSVWVNDDLLFYYCTLCTLKYLVPHNHGLSSIVFHFRLSFWKDILKTRMTLWACALLRFYCLLPWFVLPTFYFYLFMTCLNAFPLPSYLCLSSSHLPLPRLHFPIIASILR